MNEIGISSSSYTDISITECMKRIRNAGYDSVDFNLYDFCQANGPMLSPDWKEWLKKVRQATKDAGLIVGQIHAIFGLFAAAGPSIIRSFAKEAGMNFEETSIRS